VSADCFVSLLASNGGRVDAVPPVDCVGGFVIGVIYGENDSFIADLIDNVCQEFCVEISTDG